jgi:hypothetical protein
MLKLKIHGFIPPFYSRPQDLTLNKAREINFLSGVFAFVAHRSHVPFDFPPPRLIKLKILYLNTTLL